MRRQSGGARFSIAFKLIVIITILVLLSLGAITILVSVMVSADLRLTAEDNNFTVNQRSAAEAEAGLFTLRANAMVLLETLNAVGAAAVLYRQASAFFFEWHQDVAAIALIAPGMPAEQVLTNARFCMSRELDGSLADAVIERRRAEADRALRGETLLLNCAPDFGAPVLALFFPWQGGGEDQAVAIFFSLDQLGETFATGINSSFMINQEGDILVHGDMGLVLAGANVGNQGFIRSMQESQESSIQTLYTGEEGTRYFGAFTKLNIAGAAVVTIIEYNKVFEGIAATTRRNGYLTLMVLFISSLFIWFFSRRISGPLRQMAEAAVKIKEGDFGVTIRVKKSRDEIGLLTESFAAMGRGLAERERLKDAFGRFTNRELAERAMNGDLVLGGETRHATIFFSDIRSFTAISEKLSPLEVVEFLNDYMTRMVRCVNNTGGVVDKFIGDAVMAVWGAPVSMGSPQADALNAVRAALAMRRALMEYNQDRGAGKPYIKIGCGLNTGDVVAGQIGSQERMEYTVIGDAVNLASRTEALNKPLGTDILITENTWDLVNKAVITEEMPPVRVKGKEKPIRLFAVVNLCSAPGTVQEEPRDLDQVRRMLGTEAPDLSAVDTGSEEKKYKIG